MGKYFGTDGARGRADDTLTLDMAIKIGRYLGWYYGKNHHVKTLIGKDTRLSSDMLEMGLAAGTTSCGVSVYLLGVCPTSAVPCLIQREHPDCGIMVSAGRNPFHDNGVKLFNGDDCKMNPEIKLEAERHIDNEVSVEVAHNEKVGSVIEWEGGLKPYESWLKEIAPMGLSGINILLGLANGSIASYAAETLSELGTTAEVIHPILNGININTKCGFTHPEELQGMMKEGNYYAGFALDGDAGRLVAVDEDGNLIDGDYTMYICGCYMHDKRILHGDVVVTTVTSNPGLCHALKAKRLKYEQTAIDDKYAFECVREHDYSVGGEQSGHIVFHVHVNTGGGLLTTVELLEIMVDTKRFLKELCASLFIYPQLLISTPVHDEHTALRDKRLLAAVDIVAQGFGDEGRTLVRPSGTESLVHVMAETKTDALYVEYVSRIVDPIKEKGL